MLYINLDASPLKKDILFLVDLSRVRLTRAGGVAAVVPHLGELLNRPVTLATTGICRVLTALTCQVMEHYFRMLLKQLKVQREIPCPLASFSAV